MKFLIWLVKVLLMLGLLAAAVTGWIFLLFILGGGLSGSGPSGGVAILIIILLLASAALYIFLCVKISRLGTEKPEKTDSFWKKAKQPLLIIVPVILIAVGFMLVDPAMALITEMRAKHAVRTADEIIDYQNDRNELINYTILDTGLDRNSILINYRNKTVSFIFDASYEQLEKYKLEKGEIPSDQHLQYITKLSSPGKTFSTYYSGEENMSHRTTGLRLEMEDGSVYSTLVDNEYLAINSYPWVNIMNAQEASDVVINYGRNSLKENYFGIESNTLFIDSGTKNVSVVSGDEQAVSCYTFELVPFDRVEDIYLQAKIDLDIGTLYTYTGRFYPDAWEKKRTDGMVLITKDGKIFADDDDSDPHGVYGYWDFYNSEYRCSEDHVDITENGIINR